MLIDFFKRFTSRLETEFENMHSDELLNAIDFYITSHPTFINLKPLKEDDALRYAMLGWWICNQKK